MDKKKVSTSARCVCVRVFGALPECFIPPKEGVLKKKEEKNFKAQNAANCFALNDSVAPRVAHT